ncbi:hypothetical protein [Flavicella sp.]|uniref:hypothetical protein n=1 Tax=Flavicella sp. TaxID=2957742 RepID=UPI002629F1D0|nr:hypothetical protein [Flavicella sp.]MDG1806170.1 hypothetical protein [Flavicella sp.]MDG2280708.1 hypothetical protein [Flavicella sp.]
MDIQTFSALQKNATSFNKEEIQQLENIVEKYPYFQSAKAILLKAYKKTNNYKYNKSLKNTAAITIDRSVLFDYISSFQFEKPRNPETKPSTIKTVPVEENISSKENESAPFEFDQNEAHSFNQWLQLTTKKPIERIPKKDSALFKNKDLIDKFIDLNPTIKPIPKEAQSSSTTENSYQENELMTETLARVYLEQKKYSNAIKAYNILILKYPEKSGFFADQIKKIEHLKNK